MGARRIKIKMKTFWSELCRNMSAHRYTILVSVLLMQLVVFFSTFYLWAASSNVEINPYNLWTSEHVPVFMPKKFFHSSTGLSDGDKTHEISNNTHLTSIPKKKYYRHTLIEVLDMLKLDDRKVMDINCQALFKNDTEEIVRVKNYTRKVGLDLVAEASRNCESFRTKAGYINHHLSEMEQQFPIAFSILVHDNISQMERLLRTIYRPQNSYCIHVDKKSSESVHRDVMAIAECFNNVFIANPIEVNLRRFSVLRAELNCISELLDKFKQWKYFINLSGQDFPLKSNYELVQILQAYNKTNDLEQYAKDTTPQRTDMAGPTPYGINPIIGSRQVVIGRTFADFCVHHTYGVDILNWTRFVEAPDELFFSTLSVTNVGAPGSYKGDKNTDLLKRPYLARFKTTSQPGFHQRSCGGGWSNELCVFGASDMPLLYYRRELFALKFHQEYQPAVYECMEELIHNRTRDYYYEKRKFDVSYYKHLDFVTNRV